MKANVKNKWTLSEMPPSGHADVGGFFARCVQEGDDEKVRLGLEERWRFNHQMYRGDHWGTKGKLGGGVKKLTMNLIFANIQRTVANLTAKMPVVEAVEIGNYGDPEAARHDKVLTAWLKKWWEDYKQGDSMVDAAHQMEIYGPAIDKYILDNQMPDTVVVDPFAFGKAPGVYETIQLCPYVYHKEILRIDAIERLYGLPEGTVQADEVYSSMGEDREESVLPPSIKAGSYAHSSGEKRNRKGSGVDAHRAIVTEVWCKDYSGQYADNIRVVTYTNHGNLVLSDTPNPNINWELFNDNEEFISKTYMFGRFPFKIAESYRDKTTNWGFSALEQTADINQVLDELVSRLYWYIAKSLLPVLIIPKDTGIVKTQINNKPGLILQPNSSTQAGAIRYMDPPRVSLDVYKFIDMLRSFFDQVWHIEDADRGERPSGIIAAQAIQALQERNAVLMRAKIRAIDSLVEGRGKAAISMLQNFGFVPESVLLEGGEAETLLGIDLAGKEFNFMVESGSMVQKTTMQIQAQALELFRMGAIDRQALLEAIDFPGWKAVVERTGETQLDQAISILVDAGLPEEEAAQLKEYLMQPNQKEEQS